MSGAMPAVQVGMGDYLRLLTQFSPAITVCVRGRHAVGKSEGVYQAALLRRADFYKDSKNAAMYDWTYEQGLPVIERRLSQLTEGDLTGMPDMDKGRKSTVFKPCDWLIDACERPVVLFLDERNRALEGVKQAVFQLMDSRAFYGNKLHPDTIVVVAENVGEHYNVQQCDPAEVSRAATVELCPSEDEWLAYASQPGKCHDLTVSFIRGNKEHLEYNPEANKDKARKAFEPNKKYPDRRSWFKLDRELQTSGLIDRPNDPMFYIMAASMVGIEAALTFVKFAQNFDRQIKVEDILTNWANAKRVLGSSATSAKYMELAKKLEVYFKANALTDAQAEQVGNFMKSCPPEPRMVTWAALQGSVKNLFKVHKHVEDLMVKTATGEDTSDLAASASGAEASVAPPKQRGPRR